MGISAVICELNPLHKGHIYLFNKLREQTENAVCAIMSGSFTQRGDVAITNKFTRARLAIENGADLVIELPTVYAVSSAQNFAGAGVQIAAALGCCDVLGFGCENPELLERTSAAMSEGRFENAVRDNMKSGMYYPQAVEQALRNEYSDELADVVSQPNNILALEYIKALNDTALMPCPIQRTGAAHDSEAVKDGTASASYIRGLILQKNNFSEFVPVFSESDFSNPAEIGRLETAILYKLRMMTADEIKKLPDISEGLENRFFEAARSACSLKELLDSVKTKRYTHARLRRIIISALLGIEADMAKTHVPYLRVLAFNKTGAELLGKIGGKLPLITNVSDGYRKLTDEARRIFDVDLRATDIYSLATQTPQKCGRDFTEGVIKL